MTTRPDEQISDALDRADAGLLARRLDARTCPTDLLGRMVRHPAPRIRHLGLTLLAERTDTPNTSHTPDTPDAGGRGEYGDGHLALLARLCPNCSASPGTPAQTREVLTRLVEENAPPPGTRPDPELRSPVEELLRHPVAGVRLHAHRTSRALFDRDTHARLTALLLSDPLPDVVRMAVRTLGRAAWEPALPDLVRLLDHRKPVVRRAARDALIGFGGAAVAVLRRAEAHARPDRRSLYTDALAEIAGGGAVAGGGA